MITLVKDRKNLLILIGTAVLSFLVFTVAAVFITSFVRDSKFNKSYEAAEAYYFEGNYRKGIRALESALEVSKRPEAYILLSDIYIELDELDKAIETLYVGSFRLNDDKVAARLETLKARKNSAKNGNGSEIVIGGERIDIESTQLLLPERKIEDISLLSGLSRLEKADLSRNLIWDVSPLSELTELSSLNLKFNSIEDASPLASLSALTELYLDENPIKDISVLSQLSQLKTLSLLGVSVTMAEIAELEKALPDCKISYDNVTDMPKELSLGGFKIKSTATEITLASLSITDISVLAECKNLKRLNLGGNKITDLSPLAELTELTWLSLWGNDITDISPLAGLTKLASLDLNNNNITDLSPLSDLSNLEEVYLNNNGPFTSLMPLANMTRLQNLGLEATGIDDEDAEVLRSIVSLRKLQVGGNSISENALANLKIILPKCDITS